MSIRRNSRRRGHNRAVASRPGSRSAHSHRARLQGGVLVLLMAGVVAPHPVSDVRAQGFPPTPVVATAVTKQTVTAAQTFVGTVMPHKHAVVGSAVDGRVTEFAVDEGQRVEAGQLIAQLLTDTIQLELAAAKAELENRRHRLKELEAGTRPEELEQAKARLASAEARRDFTALRRDRLQESGRRQGAVTEDELDQAVAVAIEAEQAAEEAKAAYALAVAGPREEQIAQARAMLAVQQAIVDKTADQIAKHAIRSRFDGYVIEEHTEIGQWVKSGDPVAEVVAIDEVEIVAQVVEQSVPFIKPGETVRVEIPAIPDQIFDGVVIATVPQADVRARTFPVKIGVKNEINDSVPLLKAGMYARVALPVGNLQDALLVPKDAIVLGGPAPVVFVLPDDAKPGAVAAVRPVPVQLGVSTNRLIQVLGDLQRDNLVIVQGNERLRPGQQVNVVRIESTPANQNTPDGAQSAAR